MSVNEFLKACTRLVGLVALVTAPFVLLVATVVWLDGLGGSGGPAKAQAASIHPSTKPVMTENLTIVTDAQTGKDGYIAFDPTNFTLPAHSTVRIRISNFDGATPQKPARYARVWGTVGGTVQVQKFNPVAPNKLGRALTFRAVNPRTQVSHTFTVAGVGSMNINAPVYPSSVTTFVIRTGKPGHYSWRCWNPCGGGPQGWTEAMSQRGYMTGTITVA